MEQFCQSCGMPLFNEEVLGTEANGEKSDQYCSYCYLNGAFNAPNLSKEEMIEIGVDALLREGMNEQEARGMMQSILPQLKRWRSEYKDVNQATEAPIKQCTRSEITLLGIAARTSNRNEITDSGVIPKLWEQFWQHQIPSRIPTYQSDQPVYGCYIDYENGANGEYTIFIGVEAKPEVAVPEGLERIVIPAAKYAVFQSRQDPTSIYNAWRNIWQWAELGQETRTFTGDFEVYENGNPTLIYIAIE